MGDQPTDILHPDQFRLLELIAAVDFVGLMTMPFIEHPHPDEVYGAMLFAVSLPMMAFVWAMAHQENASTSWSSVLRFWLLVGATAGIVGLCVFLYGVQPLIGEVFIAAAVVVIANAFFLMHFKRHSVVK